MIGQDERTTIASKVLFLISLTKLLRRENTIFIDLLQKHVKYVSNSREYENSEGFSLIWLFIGLNALWNYVQKYDFGLPVFVVFLPCNLHMFYWRCSVKARTWKLLQIPSHLLMIRKSILSIRTRLIRDKSIKRITHMQRTCCVKCGYNMIIIKVT